MSGKERFTAILGGLLVVGIWATILVMNRSSVQPAPRLLPTEASLPAMAPTTSAPPVIQQPTELPVEPTESSQVTENRLIVYFAPESTQAEREAYIESLGGTLARQIEPLNAAVLSLPDAAPLPASPVITTSEPDYLVSALLDVSDPHYAEQWGLSVIGAPDAWLVLPDDAPQVQVAVIDSGICANHPDLAGRVLAGYDFVDEDAAPDDTFGHGCAVSGVIAANVDNEEGIAGVAPNAQIMPLRVLDGQGIGTYSDVAAAIVYAADSGAQVINLSLGGPNASSLLADAVHYAIERDVLVIAAAGNTGREGVLYPAAYDGVIAVGSIDPDLQRSSFSTYGPQIALLAPGRDILSIRRDGTYAALNGTSMAAPHVSGAAAILIARGESLELNGGILSLGEGEVAQPPTPVPADVPPEYQALHDKIIEKGQLRVIIGLNAPYQSEGQLSSTQVQTQRAGIAQAQQMLLTNLSAYDVEILSQSNYWTIPALGLSVDREALEYLIRSPEVTYIAEDRPVAPALVNSVPKIDVPEVWAFGFDGTGQAVAILDTGVDYEHEMLDGGRVVNEACFSSTVGGDNASNICPGGVDTVPGTNTPGSAMPNAACLPATGCFHGTHVAGIALGQDGSHPSAPDGVAPGASIVAVQVFSRFDGAFCQQFGVPSPCLLSYIINQVSALNHIKLIHDDLQGMGIHLASVNMSLGGDRTTTFCDSDSLYASSAALIDDLFDMGVATVASSGNGAIVNGSYVDGIGAPACIQNAVSVGSTVTSTDAVSSFSQSAPILDLLAPGQPIVSALVDTLNGYTTVSGTSMSAPHVAGAWALLKQAKPNATVNEILNAFTTTGVPVLDTRGGINRTKPRIDVDDALAVLLSPTVNTTNDISDGTCDSSHCSLREAIIATNSTAGLKETIKFNISGGGARTITLGSNPLPVISDPVIIDGTTQPGFSGAPVIEIDGINVTQIDPLLEIGLNVIGGSSVIKGLVINNFGSTAINLSFGGNNIVTGNYLGTEPNGTTAAPNREGVRICSSSNNRVGGTTTAERNIISGNSDDGINICQLPGFPMAANNLIQGNYIGLNVSGNAVLPNEDDGIKIEDAINNVIGGAASGAGNVISGNGSAGIRIVGPEATGQIIQGNIIGANAAGNDGFFVFGTPGNNFSNFEGILLVNASNTLIGGTSASMRNLISGNDKAIVFTGASTNNTVQGNFIGTNLAGTASLPNQNQFGIFIGDTFDTASTNNLIGGTAAGAGNVISGNQGGGIFVYANSNTIQGNFIGTNLSATLDLGNGVASGIGLFSSDNLVGGTAAGAGNVIAFNADYGVAVGYEAPFTEGNNAILGNRIFGNKPTTGPSLGLGIDLNINGATANDTGDGDTGANNMQNFPVLTGAVATYNTMTIAGTLNSAVNTTYRVEFFYNNTCDPSGYGEGQFFLGAQNVTTDGSGNVAFSAEFTTTLNNQHITATATDPNNNTSEFSACHLVTQDPNMLVVNTTSGALDSVCDAQCSLHDAVAVANSTSGSQTVVFHIPGSGPFIIQPSAALPAFGDLTIDATTQPGYSGSPVVVLDGSLTSSGSGLSLFSNTTIKGLVIHSFKASGITITGSNNVIQANSIGTDVNGTAALPNQQHGIWIKSGTGTRVGGTSDEQGNIIAFNGADGIYVEGGSGHDIVRNAIHTNTGLGIDLGANGVTANDNSDGDTGPNNLQNFPIITNVIATLSNVTIEGTLNSKANTSYRLDFYHNDTCDPSGNGEGQRYLGTADLTTNASGNGIYSTVLNEVLDAGTFISVTATDTAAHNTSEFSACANVIRYAATPQDFTVQVLSEIDIQLSWTDASPDETHWLIERSLAGQNHFTQIASIPTGGPTVYHDAAFLCSKSYDYRIRAYNQPGDYYSLYTSVQNAAPTCPTLNAPGSFGLTAAQHQITLNWTDTNTTETGYRVEYSANNGQTWTLLTTTPANAMTFVQMGLICNTTHSFRVTAVRDHDGALSATTPVETATTSPCPPLTAPTGPAASALSRSTIQFTWADSAPGQTTAFHLERSTNGTDWTQFAVVPASTTSVIDSNLNCGTNYQYRARAFRSEDNAFSPYSAVASATTSSCPAPVNHTVGLYKAGVWQFWQTTQTNQPAITFSFGPAESGWTPVIGDWDGDGVDGIGVYKNGLWLLRNVTGNGSVDTALLFGPTEPGWQPIVGDWNGDGVDGIGVYKNGLWLLRQTPTQGQPTSVFNYGPAESGWKAIAGDWDGGGTATVGLFKDGLWLLSNQLPAVADVPPFALGQTGWMPVAGDWDQDSRETAGVYKDGMWHLRNSNSAGQPDAVFGLPTGSDWQPVSIYEGGLSGLTILSMPPDSQPTAVPTTRAATMPVTSEPPTATPEPEITEEPTVEVTQEIIPTETPEPSPTDVPSATLEPATPEPEVPDEAEATEAVEG